LTLRHADAGFRGWKRPSQKIQKTSNWLLTPGEPGDYIRLTTRAARRWRQKSSPLWNPKRAAWATLYRARAKSDTAHDIASAESVLW